ncbi:histone H2A-beta, sperm-like [Dromiciops gliroides]|uniref:histone H2A-beta, sperm-like n=1 Tax=Dromiciops gliroides TaxID=33562 RepID=UPI001CC6A5BB|nr:histone H2A-beta, sperm-like [Dromiciops gliroides]
MSTQGKINIKKNSSSKISQSYKAGLRFPIGRIYKYLKTGNYAKRISTEAPIFLAAVLEYLTTELLELSGNVAQANKKIRITPLHIQLALQNDEELQEVLAAVTIPEGGVVPHVHFHLLSRKTPRDLPDKKPSSIQKV